MSSHASSRAAFCRRGGRTGLRRRHVACTACCRLHRSHGTQADGRHAGGWADARGAARLLQPIADAVKLLIKKTSSRITRTKCLDCAGVSMTAALTSMGAIAFGPAFQWRRDINVGLLFVIGVQFAGIFGIVLGVGRRTALFNHGRASQHGAVGQHETAAGLALVSGLLLAGTLKIRAIVDAQQHFGVWFVFLHGGFLYLVWLRSRKRIAHRLICRKRNRARGRLHDRIQRLPLALYFLGEYANISWLAPCDDAFLGGWLRPFRMCVG